MAVDDIKGTLEAAVLKRLALQVSLVHIIFWNLSNQDTPKPSTLYHYQDTPDMSTLVIGHLYCPECNFQPMKSGHSLHHIIILPSSPNLSPSTSLSLPLPPSLSLFLPPFSPSPSLLSFQPHLPPSQVELALTVEEQFPKRLRRYFIIGSREILPNRSLTLWEKFRYHAWGGERFDSSEKISNALHPPQVSRGALQNLHDLGVLK